MQIFQITGAASPRIHVSETYNVFMKRFMSVCICCLVGTAAAMGPGGSSGTGGSSSSTGGSSSSTGGSSSSTGGSSSSTGGSVLQPEVGISAIQVYNQGVDLMHAKKFAAARVKFEQAIQANPRFAEAHKNLGFTLSQQGPQNYSRALEHYNKAIQLKPKMAEAYEYRAMLLSRMGRKADAEKDLATLKKLNPKLAGEL
jgi:TolA-binding protein